ncbi:outer membrane protein assembly factor BamD [Derxia gummosa]|uniref:Outer membrane protein assembly factor BamD n=1 Tax=Derxia gummosa DSM 723 TaxID=1121388 RepID=A0A8B6X3N5_9BURK|nr:outer membrane protein assembly factor BamD [Derxia gummosa]
MAALVAGLGACGSAPKKNPTAEELYSEAKEDLDGGAWDAAGKKYDQIQSRFPFGRIAQQAMIEQAYAQWKAGDTAQSLATIDRFLRQYPNHPNVDYLYYLRGLVNFNDGSGILGAISRQDPTERDTKALHDSFDAFRELVERYPDSRYADDARGRMRWLVNAMAAYELHVARYYYRRGAYVAALSRAQTAITDFQTTQSNEEALYIMYAAYDRLGMDRQRDDTQRVLAQNYPDSRFMKEGLGQPDKKWWQFW